MGLPCAAYDFGLPPGSPQPRHPPEVCLTAERVALGRRLFYDRRLSLNQAQSCASCHQQARGFTDGLERPLGSTGERHPRNVQGLANVGFFQHFTRFNPEVTRLDNQALIPLFSESTTTTIRELAITGKEHVIIERFQADAELRELFQAAFPRRAIDVTTMVRALAAFQTTLVSYRSAYDRGDLSPAAKRGLALFRSERAGCASCHSGPSFNRDESTGRQEYHNVGLYNVLGRGDYPDHTLHGPRAIRRTQGLALVTGRAEDRGRFRTPSLRNVALTGPYMHDGSIATLAEAIAHFDRGGRAIGRGPLRGDGRTNPNKDPRVRRLGLTAAERSNIAAFLEALTDECFVTDPRYSAPPAAQRSATGAAATVGSTTSEQAPLPPVRAHCTP